MKTYLQLNTSLHGTESQSSRLARQFIETLVRTDRSADMSAASARVVVRDLAGQPLPHLTAERFTAFVTAPEQRTADQARIAAESDALVAELAAADVVVIGLPMYNFGVPSTLKAYFDHVARAGVTFRYTAKRSRRTAARQACLRHRDARRQARGHPQRPAERLRPAVPRLHRHHRRRVHLRRGPGDGRGKPYCGDRRSRQAHRTAGRLTHRTIRRCCSAVSSKHFQFHKRGWNDEDLGKYDGPRGPCR